MKTITFLILASLLFASSCKKKSRELTTVNFHLINPVTGEGYAGVKVSILQDKQKGSGLNISQETETVWQGVTDANGKASYSFKCYNNDKYSYWQTVEKSFYFDANQEILREPEFQPLNKNEVNDVVYKVVKKLNYVLWIKNINCFDSNDKCRWRSISLADVFDSWSIWIPSFSSPSNPNGFYEGCFDQIYTHTHTRYLGC